MPDELYTNDEVDAAVNEALKAAEERHRADLEQAEKRAREQLAGELAAAATSDGATGDPNPPPAQAVDPASIAHQVMQRTSSVERGVLESARLFKERYGFAMPAEVVEDVRNTLADPNLPDEALSMLLNPADDTQKERANRTYDSIIGTNHAALMRQGKIQRGTDPAIPYVPVAGGGASADDDLLAKGKKLAQEMLKRENVTMEEIRAYAELGQGTGLI